MVLFLFTVVFWSKKTFPVLMTYTRVGCGVLFNSSDSYNLCLSSVLSGFGTLAVSRRTSEPAVKLRLLRAATHEETDHFFSASLTRPWQPSSGWGISIKPNHRRPTNCYKYLFSSLELGTSI